MAKNFVTTLALFLALSNRCVESVYLCLQELADFQVIITLSIKYQAVYKFQAVIWLAERHC